MCPKAITIKVPTITVRISPLGFHSYAAQFLGASANSEARDGFSPVPYYLVSRSLELALKAYLLAKNVDVQVLKGELGHDLMKCLARAQSEGLEQSLSISATQKAELKKANSYYATKGFEYFQVTKAVTGYRDLPDLRTLRNLAGQLLDEIEDICLKAT